MEKGVGVAMTIVSGKREIISIQLKLKSSNLAIVNVVDFFQILSFLEAELYQSFPFPSIRVKE